MSDLANKLGVSEADVHQALSVTDVDFDEAESLLRSQAEGEGESGNVFDFD